ncbi:acetyl-CoA synthetase Acs, partial [Mycobacterium tuberculosis NRITLD12]|uniref:AMP-binding protein n=1 Tax=Mycobacterium tuberculosis TaxID=1773 RepID=UPI00045A7B0B
MSESTPEVSSSYPPPAHFAEHANARAELYREAEEDRLAFWAKQANRLSWTTPFTEVLDWSGAPFAKWFVGGELNVAYNCVDRHVEAGHGDRVAIHWEGEPVGDRRTLTYSDLLAEVSKAANALTDLGLVAGDRVAIYLPLIPEAVIAMLACARLGIMHSVVFGGFTAAALQARIVDAHSDLLAEVSKAANALTDLGLVAGDRVAIYLPLIPEAVIAMLACARLGIMHSVVFGGFTAAALQARIVDAQAKLLITADGQFRRGKPSPLKAAADEALAAIPDCSVEHVLVVRRTGIEMAWSEGRDLWWHHVVGSASPAHTPEPFDSEHPLFLLYTSGTTGKPKGIMHTSGGYLTQCCYTMRTIFDVKPDSDVFWCTADIGWVTGHTYGVYGPLCNGVTEVLYEGTPDTPDRHRHFQIIEKYGVTIYYTAPTLIRMFMKWGREIPDSHDLSSLRLLGSVGEPINPEAWRWYRDVIGGGRTPLVDTWWQTETGTARTSAPPPAWSPSAPRPRWHLVSRRRPNRLSGR